MWTPLFRGPDWMPITPKWGSFLHADSQYAIWRLASALAAGNTDCKLDKPFTTTASVAISF